MKNLKATLSFENKLKGYDQMKQLIKQTSQKQLTKIDELVILTHSVNVSNQLQCLNQENEKCVYPQNWHLVQGVSRFKYLIEKGKNKNKVVQFRLVDTNEGLSVNFVVENSQQLLNVQLSLLSTVEENIKKLDTELNKILTDEQRQPQMQNQIRPIVNLQIQNNYRPPQIIRQPEPILGLGGRPLGVGGPFGGEEYVGPNSNIFGRQGGNLRVPGNERVPPGARWDPVDPFGEEGNNQSTNQFFGFNQWGQQLPKGGFGNNLGPNGNRFI